MGTMYLTHYYVDVATVLRQNSAKVSEAGANITAEKVTLKMCPQSARNVPGMCPAFIRLMSRLGVGDCRKTKAIF